MEFDELEQSVSNAQEVAMQKVSEMTDSNDIKINWGKDLREGKTTLKESITTSDGGKDYVQKITYDAYRGRENVNLVYKNLYTTQIDATFPELITAKEMGPVQVVFLRVTEGGSVKFGTLKAGEEAVVRFYTYASGIEITDNMIEYNKTWEISDVAVAFGEAYNHLLNHLHMDPIINGTYTTTGGGLAAQKAAQEDADSPVAQLVAFDTDLETTLRNAMTILPKGSAVIANSADKFILEDAIFGSLYSDNVTPTVVQRSLSPEDFIYYDGETVKVGDKEYEYGGVASGFIYMLVPKRQLQEKIKHDLRLEALSAEPRRLIAGGQVGVTRRATYYKLGGKYGVIKVDIAA